MRLPAALVFLLVACSAELPFETDAVSLRVMTFNIEWGGKNVSFANVVKAIELSGADIVGIQEAEGNLEELATELGWFFDERNYVISRFPVYDPPEAAGRYAYVEVQPGKVIAIGNLHLPDAPYGPDLIVAGKSNEEVVANERRVRVSWLDRWLDRLQEPLQRGIPTFVTGDFNSPSHNDSANISWPVSLAMEEAGFVDVWRIVHPDAVEVPGLTWWAARPELDEYAPGEGDPEDRIDMIWSSAKVEPRSAELVGEEGRAGVTYSVNPWPSDHRAVVAEFIVRPKPMPDLLTTEQRVYREDKSVTVRFEFSELAPDELIVRNLNSAYEERHTIKCAPGAIEVSALVPGAYVVDAKLGERELSRPFWILAKNADPSIEVAQDEFDSGSPVLVRWSNGPGFRNDYIALYSSSAFDDNTAYLHYVYVDALPVGELDLRAAIAETGQELVPGRYIVKLMKDDGYTALARSKEFLVN